MAIGYPKRCFHSSAASTEHFVLAVVFRHSFAHAQITVIHSAYIE